MDLEVVALHWGVLPRCTTAAEAPGGIVAIVSFLKRALSSEPNNTLLGGVSMCGEGGGQVTRILERLVPAIVLTLQNPWAHGMQGLHCPRPCNGYSSSSWCPLPTLCICAGPGKPCAKSLIATIGMGTELIVRPR